MIDHETSIFLGDLIVLILFFGLAALTNEWGKGRVREQEAPALRLAKVRREWTRPRMLR